ncbi:MAG: hypothetical protein HUU23_10070 [Caldilineales bacterium]|nr:hypothetical protein [Caldilineales bacterium]
MTNPVDLSKRVGSSGEAALGPDESGALTTYLLYGVLAPYETGRRLRPGSGREEILFVINGDLRLEGPAVGEMVCKEGTAVLLQEGSDQWLSNLTNGAARYVLAGGFTEPARFYRWMQSQQLAQAPR